MAALTVARSAQTVVAGSSRNASSLARRGARPLAPLTSGSQSAGGQAALKQAQTLRTQAQRDAQVAVVSGGPCMHQSRRRMALSAGAWCSSTVPPPCFPTC